MIIAYKVIQVSSNDVIVKNESNEDISCKLAGKFRIKHKQNSNLIRVGDWVEIKEDESDSHVITKVLPRKSKFARLKPHSKNYEQVIASNIDQILIFVSFADPMYKTGFIDRFLTVAESEKIETILCFNKLDLTDIHFFEDEINYYKTIVDHIEVISVIDGIHITNLTSYLENKVTVITGPSGAGKSSFINRIDDSVDIRTSEVSDYSHKGLHTTTVSHYYMIKKLNGAVIDTPGLREFGLFGFEKDELKLFYRDFFQRSSECKYHNCLHINEPGCAVKVAIEREEIPYFRYESYLSMYDEIEQRDREMF